MKVVGFIPVKLNSERVPQKNIKEICKGMPLVACPQKILLSCDLIDEVYVYCSSPEIKNYLLPEVKYIDRDVKYDRADADVNDMYYKFTQKVDADIYVLLHATAPFMSVDSLNKGIKAIESGMYDSALTARVLREFLWIDDKPFNFSLEKIPRTQDLKEIMVETTGVYMFTKKAMEECRSRTGKRPYIINVSKLEATDIDYPEDFDMASYLYPYYRKILKGGQL